MTSSGKGRLSLDIARITVNTCDIARGESHRTWKVRAANARVFCTAARSRAVRGRVGCEGGYVCALSLNVCSPLRAEQKLENVGE